MDKARLIGELEQLLDELFTPAIPRKHDDVKKGGPTK